MFATHPYTPNKMSLNTVLIFFSGNFYLDRKLYLWALVINGEFPDIMTALSLSLKYGNNL